MRGWRKTHHLNEEQKKKANARTYAGVYKRRGLLAQQDCKDCGLKDTEMHHEDYDKPLDVIWLCRICHLKRHAPPHLGSAGEINSLIHTYRRTA